jgi:hypothetical protein
MELAHFKAGMLIWMWMGVATTLLVLMLERKPAASVGMRTPTAADLAYAALALALTLLVEAVWVPAVILALGATPQSIAEHSRLVVLSTPVRLLMTITEPVFEELNYRGFLIERLYTLTGAWLWRYAYRPLRAR